MDTFEEIYRARHQCGRAEFLESVYRRCLYPRALRSALLFGGLRSKFFAPDRELVTNVGKARSMDAVHEELHSYFSDGRDHHFLRGRLKLRLCTQRLARLAAKYFNEQGTPTLFA